MPVTWGGEDCSYIMPYAAAPHSFSGVSASLTLAVVLLTAAFSMAILVIDDPEQR